MTEALGKALLEAWSTQNVFEFKDSGSSEKIPIFPNQPNRFVQKYYYSKSRLNWCSVLLREKRPELSSSLTTEEIAEELSDFLHDVLLQTDGLYQPLSAARGILSSQIDSEETLAQIGKMLLDFIDKKFPVRLYVTRLLGLSTSSYVLTDSCGLLGFDNLWKANVFRNDEAYSMVFHGASFPPDHRGKKFEDHDFTWLIVPTRSVAEAKAYFHLILGSIIVKCSEDRYLGVRNYYPYGNNGIAFLSETNLEFLERGDWHLPHIYTPRPQLDEGDCKYLSTICKLACGDKKINRKIRLAIETMGQYFDATPEQKLLGCSIAADALYNRGGPIQEDFKSGHSALFPNRDDDWEKLKHVSDLRGDIAHGRRTHIYKSKKYQKFWKAYNVDPVEFFESYLCRAINQIIRKQHRFESYHG